MPLAATHRPGLAALNRRGRRGRSLCWLRMAVGLLAVALCGELTYALLASPRLAVREVVLRGDQQIVPLVAPHIRLPAGTNILTAPLDEVERQAKSVPAVRQARVSRDLPAGLVVTVERREAMAVVRSAECAVLIDPAGVPFTVPEEWGWGLPEFVSPRLASGDMDGDEPAADIAAMLRVLRALGPDPRLRATRVQMMREGRVEVTLDSGAVVNFGRPKQLGLKARCLAAALEELGPERIGRLDLADPGAAFWEPRAEVALTP